MQNRKWAPLLVLSVSVLVLIALGVGGTIALEAFLDDPNRGATWPSAIGAVSTLVLVIITGVYVAFTGQLVRLQTEANAQLVRSEEERLVRRVMETVYPGHRMVSGIAATFPLDESRPPMLVEREYMAMDVLKDSLRAVSTQMPSDLMLPTIKAAAHLGDAVLACQTVELAIVTAIHEAEKAKTEPSWTRVRTFFYENSSARKAIGMGREQLPEWADIREGTLIREAAADLDDLENLMQTWLQRDASGVAS